MNRYEYDPLMNELLAGDDTDDFRAASLDQMLSLARRRRRRRQTARILVWTVTPLLFVAGLVSLFRPSSRSALDGQAQSAASQEAAPSASQSPARRADVGGIHYLTDDELLTMFPGRPVALIGRPGEQKLVFLDQAKATHAEARIP